MAKKLTRLEMIEYLIHNGLSNDYLEEAFNVTDLMQKAILTKLHYLNKAELTRHYENCKKFNTN